MNCPWLSLNVGSVGERSHALILAPGSRLTGAPTPVPIDTGAVNICRRRATAAERIWGSLAGSRAGISGTGGPVHPRRPHGPERDG